MTPNGGGLGHFPPGAAERALRDERRKLIRRCRRKAERFRDEQGRKWVLVRLPDGQAADYGVPGTEEAA